VVLQGIKPGVDGVLGRANQVSGVVAAATGAVTNQVVALAVQRSAHVRRSRRAVPGDDGVPRGHARFVDEYPATVHRTSAGAAGAVPADGAAGESQPEAVGGVNAGALADAGRSDRVAGDR